MFLCETYNNIAFFQFKAIPKSFIQNEQVKLPEDIIRTELQLQIIDKSIKHSMFCLFDTLAAGVFVKQGFKRHQLLD
jgi:hypothetical protein